MDKLISDYIDACRDEFIDDLRELVSVKSVRSPAVPGCPFGENCAQALEKAKNILSRHGFSSVNYDNYAVEADLGARPKLMLLAHLDVVPECDGWNYEPYNLTVENGLAFGRGTTDDKGAALACLYAMKAVRDVYGVPGNGVRLVLGAGEETGSEDMKHYFGRREKLPFTLSPDADYPVINLEKGRLAPVFSGRVGGDTAIISVAGGDTANIVPGKARAVFKYKEKTDISSAAEQAKQKTGADFKLSFNGEICEVLCCGQSAHAASPEKGNNANTALIYFLTLICRNENSDFSSAVNGLASLFPHGDINGKSCGAHMCDEISGETTLNFGILSFDGDSLVCGLDIRCPLCTDGNDLIKKIEKAVNECGLGYDSVPEFRPAHYVPADSFLVREVLSVYEDCTGRKGECLSIGGGTYVHDIEGGIAFGIEFPGRDYRIHGADEYADIDELLLTAKMYAQFITDLEKQL